jgi:hypothetical protein
LGGVDVPGEEHEIMAAALEADAALQERGSVREIGENYDPTYARILKINADYDESVGFAFTFWDNWVDASNHEWQYHEPIREHDWPRFAREIAQAVRRGEFPPDEFLLGQIRRKPRRSLGQWLKSLFGARRSTSGCS